jgi:hypothetical protein
VNWGAFIDEDKFDTVEIYHDIDSIILGMVHDVCIPHVIETEELGFGFKMYVNNSGASQLYREVYVDKVTAFKEYGGLQLLLPGFFFKQIVKNRKELPHPKSVWKQLKLDVTSNV